MTEVSKEAVEALSCALKQTSCGDLVSADVVISEIEKRGFTITRADPAPLPAAPVADAVEALEKAISDAFADNGPFVDMPKTIIAFLQKQRWHIRRETMTESELERDACYLHSRAQAGNDTVDEIMALAKKYRG